MIDLSSGSAAHHYLFCKTWMVVTSQLRDVTPFHPDSRSAGISVHFCIKASETVLSPRGSTATTTLGPKSCGLPGAARFSEMRLPAIVLAAANAGPLGSGVIVRTA